MNITQLKQQQMETIAEHREMLRKEPHLRWLFFEITNKCNLSCKHCGSSCTAIGQTLSISDIEKTLLSVHSERPMIAITGGEPMLHPEIFAIGELIRSMGLSWGMTTNGTLIDDNAALMLKQAGMSTVSVSLDGMEESHDSLRRQDGAWRRAIRGIQSLQKAGFKPQVTSVFHHDNIGELDTLYRFLCDLGIESWRPINIEPIGRACESGKLLLNKSEFGDLLTFIRNKRFDSECNMEVTFGCSHYLGIDNERMVRDHYFLCGAGILVASVRSNGDICSCLDIPNRQELVQGNIYKDSFIEVWNNGFQVFRKDRTVDSSKCVICSERFLCGGDSTHTWDYERNEPQFCHQDYLK